MTASTQWDRLEGGGLPVHVTPVRDLREHDTTTALCPCMPRVLDNEDAPPTIVHNAYDGRETGEVCRKALDAISHALVDHGHTWTDEERDAYEHALLILDMHWPAKPDEVPR